MSYTLTGLNSDGLVKTVSVLSSVTACGSASVTYTAPASCTIAPPALAVVVGTPVCNSVTNNYTATGTVSLSNAVASTLTITDNGTTIGTVSLTAGQTTASFSATGVSNIASHTVIATLTGGISASATYTAPVACTVVLTPRLLLAKLVSASKAKLGDVVTYTVVLANAGPVAATNVVINDIFSAGLSPLPSSVSVSTGTYTAATWSIASLPAGATATLTYSMSIVAEGVHYNTARIPGNEVKVCTSVPYSVCKGAPYSIELEAPAGYSRYQWYRTTPTGTTLVSDVTATSINAATAGSYTITQAGEYKLVVNEGVLGSCPDLSCCPVIVEEVEVPQYTAMVKNPSCVGTTPQANGEITLMNLGVDPTAYVYQVSPGTSFSAATALNAAPVAVPASGVVAMGLAGGNYTVRLWVMIAGEPSCPRDVTVALVANCDCPAEICVPVVIRKTKTVVKRP